MSRRYWLKTLIPLLIPGINLILLLVWAFGGKDDGIRRHFSQACLIIMAGLPAACFLIALVLNLLLSLLWSFYR